MEGRSQEGGRKQGGQISLIGLQGSYKTLCSHEGASTSPGSKEEATLLFKGVLT